MAKTKLSNPNWSSCSHLSQNQSDSRWFIMLLRSTIWVTVGRNWTVSFSWTNISKNANGLWPSVKPTGLGFVPSHRFEICRIKISQQLLFSAGWARGCSFSSMVLVQLFLDRDFKRDDIFCVFCLHFSGFPFVALEVKSHKVSHPNEQELVINPSFCFDWKKIKLPSVRSRHLIIVWGIWITHVIQTISFPPAIHTTPIRRSARNVVVVVGSCNNFFWVAFVIPPSIEIKIFDL